MDPGQDIFFEFTAQALGEQDLTFLVINGSETVSVSSPLTIMPSPVTNDEEFIKLLFTGLYSRSPEPYELSENLQLLQDRIYTREQIIERLRTDFEFTKARNIILAHKTLKGEWKKIEDALLESKDPDETPAIGAGAEGGVRPDDPGDAGSATLVPLNTPITASIETANDIDYFKVQTLGVGKNTTLTISVSAGHPGVFLISDEPQLFLSDRLNIVGPGIFPVPSVSGWETNQAAGPGTSSTISVTYNLANFEGDNNWYIEVPVFGNPVDAGPGKDYTIQFTMEIPAEDDDGGIAEPSSEVIDFKIRNHLWYWLDNLQYLNLYGEINTHDPESFFVRLFKNRYEQLPNPSQIARGVQLLNDDDGNHSQFQFLQDFAIENKVITTGSYNYTNTDGNGSSLSIPNVPLDAAALAETALVYTALVGEVPENGEVARLTLTPEYELRPMTERARMIMELPSFAARFGMAMPEVDLPNLRNGRKYSHGKEVLIDASSLGPDNLGGTKDDGNISNLKILLNKSENPKWTWTPDSTSLDSNISADGFYYNFTIPSGLPSGTYTFEVIAEDKNGLISRAERKIHLGTIDHEVRLLTPETDEVLDIDEIKTFKFDLGSDHNSSAYLEINGHIPWVGSLQFSAEDLPQDESTISISDGSGRSVTFEFDSDYTATATEIATVEKMYVVGGGSLSLTTDSNYLGTDNREYIVEIDGDGTGANGHDTFRWSIDGGANFNDYGIEIDTDVNNSLGSGIEITFDSNTSYQLGDRWRIKAYPINEIVEVGRYGSFADRLATTRQNFIDAVNRANNMGKLAIRAKASVVESTSSGWFNSLDENKYGIELRRLGSLPVREKITIDNLTATNTTLSTSDWLDMPWLEEGNGTQTMSLDLRKLGFTQPMLEARVVAFDELNNTVNSEPRSFTLRDPSRLSIELGDPVGRKASVRIVGDINGDGSLKASNIQVLDGGAGYTGDTAQLSIISEFGRGASLRPVVNQLGEFASVEVVSPGSGYTLSDLVLVSSPLQYKIGDSVSVAAKVRDPLSELDRVAFYVNGVELDANSTSASGSTHSTSYEFTDESAKFVTARALYGDDRDRGPSTIAEDEWMHGPGISGDRINYWGWRRHWAEQHFHGPGYVFPEWFIQDQDYWALPPPWLSLPYGPGAVPVQVNAEPEKESISITASSTVDIGQVGLLGLTYRSVDGDYDDDLKVSVYLDDQFAGYATMLEYEEPEFWEEDPGYEFEFVLPVHTSGTKEVEFYILDGDRTFTAYTSVNGEESPLTDHYQFLKQLWNSIYDRDPQSAEINAYLFALGNGSMNRAQVIEILRTSGEFANARDLLLTSKTLHGVWKTLSTVLEATDQEGYGSMGGGGGNSAAAQAAMGMPYTPADGNESDLGFYEGVEDDHGNFASAGTWIDMNSFEVLSIKHIRDDVDYFKIKSANLENEGILEIKLNKAPYGTIVQGGPPETLTAVFYDGSSVLISPFETFGGNNTVFFNRKFDLRGLKNVDYYSFEIYPYVLGQGAHLGGRIITTSNQSYVDSANFLTEAEIAQLEIESRINEFDPIQAVTYQTNNFSYTNRYGQIETHDPASFFHRLFLNKYDQEPNPIQVNRGVQVLNDPARSQLQFLQDFATENNIITVGGYNYTTSEAELSIPNVPIDAAAFAETALVYSALLDKAPTNGEVARLTLTSDYQIRPLVDRVQMLLGNGLYGKRFGLQQAIVDFVEVSNGNTYQAGQNNVVLVEAVSLGSDNQAGSLDDQPIQSVELFLNGQSVGKKNYNPSNQYSFAFGTDLSVGEYRMEAVVEDLGGYVTRAERKIYLRGGADQEVLLTSPQPGTILNSAGEERFKYSTDRNVTAYLEVDGQVHWNGFLSFDSVSLPDDGSTFSLYDGTGRDPVVFEFDQDGNASATIEDPVVIRQLGTGELELGDGGGYPYSVTREYIVEIDGEQSSPNGHDTFRWSRMGGAEANATGVEIVADTNYTLEDGVVIRFDSNTSYAFGDAWRITARANNEIVEVGKYGSTRDRLVATKRSLVGAINRARTSGKLAILAEDAWEEVYDGSTPSNLQSELSVSLVSDGSYPLVADINASQIDAGSNVITLVHVPVSEAVGASGELSYDFSKHKIEGKAVRIRIVTIDKDGNFGYSVPWIFETDPKEGPSLRIVSPKGRPATFRIKEVGTNGDIVSVEVIDQGEGYESEDFALSIHTSTGVGGFLRARMNDNGGIDEVETVSGGTGYQIYDTVVAPAPYRYGVGESIQLVAEAVDPYQEIENVRFFVNGQVIDGNVSQSGNQYTTSYSFEDESAAFFSVQYDMAGEEAGGDVISKWLPAYNLQKFYRSEYNSPVWKWGDLDYWEYPGPWINNPLPASGLLVEHKKTYQDVEIESQTSGVVGSDIILLATYRSPTREYAENIYASVYIDDHFAGYATMLEYEEPEFWEEDPGYQFEFVLPVHTSGTKEVEFYILDGDRTFSAYTSVNGEESPLTDHYKFLKQLWNGIYDRDPQSAEINAYLFALGNGSMNRSQVIEHIRTSKEFIEATKHMLVHKTLHGTWEKIPVFLTQTNQIGIGTGNANQGVPVEASRGDTFGPIENNATDFGHYNDVEDDHSNLITGASFIGMNETDYITVLERPADIDYFRIKSQNLEDEGTLTITLNRNIGGGIVASNLGLNDFDINGFMVLHNDGSYSEMTPIDRSINDSWINSDFIVFDLNQYNNVDSYVFPISHFGSLYTNRPYLIGGVSITLQNDAYLDQANFLTEEEIEQLEIASSINDFDASQAILYETDSFSYKNRYGAIETHDPASFFHRLFLNKYDQEPNPIQVNRGVQLLRDGSRSQVDFLQQFATENNIITVGGYNYTTSANELAIPNVPIDAAAFAETALVYSALLDKAPTNAEVASLTLDPYFEVRSLAERSQMILDMSEYAAQYSVSIPRVDFLNVQNGMVLGMNDSIKVEAFDHGIDGISGTFDDGQIATVSLLLNGSPLEEKEGNQTSSEYTFDFNQSATGEYDLEVVAHNVQGEMGRAHRRIFIGTRNSTISIDTPNHGAVLSKAAPADFTFSTENVDLSNGTGYLEINGKVRWSGAIEITDDLMLDESTLILNDGTNRGAVTFEMDANESASSYEIHANTIRQSGEGNVTASGTYTGPEEGIQYWVIIDNNGTTFKWMEEGAMEPYATAVAISTNINYILDYGVQINFNSNNSYAFGDAWKIVVKPTTDLVEVETDGSFEDRLAHTKRNLITSINRANSEGLLALRAEDPMTNNRIAGMLPVTMPVNRAVVLRHDGSYPITADLNVSIAKADSATIDDVQQGMFSFVEATGTYDANVSYETNKTRWELTLSNWDALELCDGLLEVRLVHLSNDGNITYSNKRAYPVVDPSRGYVELIGPLGTVYEPGRLPTVHFSENFTTGILPWKDDANTSSIDEITITDGGAGYRWYDEDSKQFTIVSSSGFGGNLHVQKIDEQTEGVTEVYAESNSTMGAGYHESDVIVPSPPAFFDKYQTIGLSARLRDPYSEYQRVAFYFNGVETNATVEDRSGGIFGTAFMPTMPGDKFVTARALYGDSRDYGPSTPHTFGHYPCNDGYYGGKDHWGWKKSWLQQHYSTGQEFLPSWYSQLENYWIHENKEWAREAMWDGAAPLRIGEKDVYESVVIQISQSSPALQGSYGSDLLHSQMTTVDAFSEWSERVAPSFLSAQLYGNNILLDEIEVDTNNTATNRITFNFEWLVNYKLFKDAGGKVELRVIGITADGRQIISPTKTTYILPLDYSNPVSIAAMILSDLTGEPPSDEVLKEILPQVNTTDLESVITAVVELSIKGEIEHMADLVASYHVLYGEYPDPNVFDTIYIANREAMLENRALTLQAYIESEFTSIKYTSRYGIIPNDTAHFFGRLEGTNLSTRTDFVKRHYKNKYGVEASFLQSLQGAQKMWDFAGGAAAADNYLMNRSAAANFIFNLATEPIEKVGLLSTNLTYLNGMSSLRSTYLDKAKQYPIAQATNMHELGSSAEETVTSDESSGRLVKVIVDDPAFKRRFNLMWEDSAKIDGLEFWKHEDWFGHFMDEKYPWIYHADLGWLYSHGTSQKNVWLYSHSIGWFWTNREIFKDHPNLTTDNQRFIFRVRPQSTGEWEGSWSLVTLPGQGNGSNAIQVYDYGYNPF